jgi:hypothetical protein
MFFCGTAKLPTIFKLASIYLAMEVVMTVVAKQPLRA